MGTAHAILSPSAAHRWIACTPSARLEQSFPDSQSEAAAEGTLAHKLGELLILQKMDVSANLEKEFAEVYLHKLYSHAMHEHCEAYAAFVLERFAEAQTHTPDAKLFLEHHLNLSDYIPEGYGTGDAIIIADDTLDLIDLKYGKGVLVSAEDNKQMMLYGLGALLDFDFMYDIKTVRMTIFQPRIDNFSTFEMSVADLLQWAEDELKPKAKMAFEGIGEYSPGSHCQFCRAKATCKALASYNLQLAKYDFTDPALMTEKDVADVLNRADVFTSWLTAVQEYALTQAVNGKKWPGYKLVEGRSNRKYEDELDVAIKLREAGFKDVQIYKEPELKGITEMEKIVGKKTFATLLDGLVIKPPGKPTLAPAADKRPEFNSLERAKQDFKS